MKIKTPPKKTHTQESFQAQPQPAPPPPPKKKKHTEESSRSAPGADTQKAVQQLLQNAFQPAPQAAPPKKTRTQESFQPAPAPAPSSGGWNTVSINGNGTFTLPQIGTFPLPPPGGEMKKIPLQDGKFFKIRQRPDGSYEGKFGPDGQAAPAARTRTQESSFQLPPQPQPKASKHKSAPAVFQPALTALKLAQAAFQAAPSSGGWNTVSINGNGTFTLPNIGTFSLPPAGGEMKKIPLQDGKFFKIRQRPDGAYEGKFGPDAPPAPAPSSGGWNSVSTNPDRTFTLPFIGSYPLPAPGETKKIPLQDGKFFKIRQRADGSYEGKFGVPPPPDPGPLPGRLEGLKDAEGWSQVSVDADGMIRFPGLARPLYRPQPGRTDSVTIDARTTFHFRQGADGNVYGTFETKPLQTAPPGWQRVHVDPDGMIRLPGISQALYRPKPGETDALPLDARTTFRFRQGEDGEVYGTFETKPEQMAAPGWQRLYESPDGMIRIPGISQALYRPKPGQTDTLKLDPKTTLKFRQAEDGHVYGTFETKPEKLAEGWTRVIASPDGKVRVPGVEQVFGMPGEGFTDHVWVNSRTRFELRLGEDGNIEGRFVTKPKKHSRSLWDKVVGVVTAPFKFVGKVVEEVLDFAQEKVLPVFQLIAPFIPGWGVPVALVSAWSKGIDILQGDAKPIEIFGLLAGPAGATFGAEVQNIARVFHHSLQAGQNIDAAIQSFKDGNLLGGLIAGNKAVGNLAGVAGSFSQGDSLALFNSIQATTTSLDKSLGGISVAVNATKGALAQIEGGNVAGGLAALFGAGAQLTRTLTDAWNIKDGRKFADELTRVLTRAQVLTRLTGQTLQTVTQGLQELGRGGNMFPALSRIVRALGQEAVALELLSQESAQQLLGVLSVLDGAAVLTGGLGSLQKLVKGDVFKGLEELFGTGAVLTRILSYAWGKGDGQTFADELARALTKAQLLTRVTSQSLESITQALATIRGGGDMFAALGVIARALSRETGALQLISQGAFQQNLQNLDSILSTTVALTGVPGSLQKIVKGDVFGGLAGLFGTGSQVSLSLANAWGKGDGPTFANELSWALNKAQVLTRVSAQTLQRIEQALRMLRNGGDMFAALNTLAHALVGESGALQLLSQGAFQQNVRSVASVLETGGNVVELKNLLAVAIQAVGRGDIPGALETLLGVGSKTETFLGQLSQGNTATTVDELGGLLFKAQGPLGLEALGLAKLKGKIAGKNAQEVMYNFANIANTEFIAGGTGKDPVVLSPLPAQLTLSQTIGVQTPFGKVSVLAREHTFFGHDTGRAHTLIVAEIKRAGPQTSMQYTSVQNRSALELALNEAAGWVHSSSTISSLPGFKPATVQLTQGDNNVISMQRWMSNGTEGKLVSVSINDGRGAGFTEVPPSVFNALPDGLRTDVSREGGTQYAQRTGQLERNGRMVTVTYWQATYVRQNSQGQKEVVTKVFTPGDNQLAVTITRSPDGSFVYNWVPGNNGRLPGGRSNLSVPQGGRLSYSDNGNRADVVNSAGTQRDKYTRVGDGDYELVRRSEHLLYDGRSTDLRLVYKAKENIYQLVRERANRPEQVVADRLKVGPDGKPILPLEALGGLDVSRLETPQNWFAVAAPSDPNEASIPARILGFFKGFGLEAWDTVRALGDLAKLLNDANPLTLPGSMLAELIISPITGKSPAEAVNERGEKFITASKTLLDQVVAVLKLAWDLSTPVQMTNAMTMANNMVRDVLDLLNRGKLTPGAVVQIIVARTGQNPSLQAAATVLDALTNYKEVLRTGGNAEQIGRGAFRIFSTLVDFAKPAALGRKATVVEQVVIVKPLQQADLLSQLNAPGKTVVVERSSMTLENLAQLTKEMNREFALLTRGDKRMLIAGDDVSVPLTPDRMRQLSQEGWKLTAHSHLSGLAVSAGDVKVLEAAAPQKNTILLDTENNRVSIRLDTPEQGAGGRTDTISAGVLTPAQLDEAVNTLRSGGVINYIDPIFRNFSANGLGRLGQYNLDGATTMRDVARRNTALETAGATLIPTPHDMTHATMAGAGGHINNTVYVDGVNGILVAADEFVAKDFMGRYGGDVKNVDFGQYVQDNYLTPVLNSDRSKLLRALDEMDTSMKSFMPRAIGDPDFMQKALEQTVYAKRGLVEKAQDFGFLHHANYMYEGIPGPGGANTNIKTARSEAVRTAVDAAWENVINGYKTNNRPLVEKGLAELKELQLREMISNVIPKEQAAMALKDHITYHELFAEKHMAKYPGQTKADYYRLTQDKLNSGNDILNLNVPTRQEFERKRRELFPNG